MNNVIERSKPKYSCVCDREARPLAATAQIQNGIINEESPVGDGSERSANARAPNTSGSTADRRG